MVKFFCSLLMMSSPRSLFASKGLEMVFQIEGKILLSSSSIKPDSPAPHSLALPLQRITNPPSLLQSHMNHVYISNNNGPAFGWYPCALQSGRQSVRCVGQAYPIYFGLFSVRFLADGILKEVHFVITFLAGVSFLWILYKILPFFGNLKIVT
jgi:hypothetical protein